MSMHDLLLQLSQISSTLYQQTSPPDDVTSGLGFDIPDFLLPFPDLALDVPSPEYLSNLLLDAGASTPLARELSEIHSRWSNELAEQYLQFYRSSCADIATRTGLNEDRRTRTYLHLQRASRQLFRQTIEQWERESIHAVRSGHISSSKEQTAARRKFFNSDFTRLLEAVFEETPYPPLAVRNELANRSGMTVKQIKTWFQNRRSRAGKGDLHNKRLDSLLKRRRCRVHSSSSKQLPALLTPHSYASPTYDRKHLLAQPSTLPSSQKASDAILASSSAQIGSPCITTHPSILLTSTTVKRNPSSSLGLYQSSHSSSSNALSECETVVDTDSEADEESHKMSLSRSSSVTLVDESSNSLTWKSPNYTFPTRYPPEVAEDPFPCRAYNDFSFPKPAWQRVSCSASAPHTSINVSDLAGEFSQLTLNTSSITRPPDEAAESGQLMATSNQLMQPGNPIATHTYAAPLPFLVRPTCHQYFHTIDATDSSIQPDYNCLDKHVPTIVDSYNFTPQSSGCSTLSSAVGTASNKTVTDTRDSNNRAISLSMEGVLDELGLNTIDVGRVLGLSCFNPLFYWKFEELPPSLSDSSLYPPIAAM